MIDVAVVDYGTPWDVVNCVGSLRSNLFTSIEVVDAKARDWGYAHSVNSSLANGSAPYVLALNADTLMLNPPTVIVEIFETHPDIAVIGPRQVDDSGRITHAGIFGDNFKREHRYWLQPLSLYADRCAEYVLDVPTISGSIYFCRRSIWEEFGGFLETRLYYEETALDFAVRHAGHRVVYTGATTWQHLWQHSTYPESERFRQVVRSREMFYAYCAERGIECGG